MIGKWLLVSVMYAWNSNTLHTEWFETLEQCQRASKYIKENMDRTAPKMVCLNMNETSDEAAKRNALSKLSDAERKALGIK